MTKRETFEKVIQEAIDENQKTKDAVDDFLNRWDGLRGGSLGKTLKDAESAVKAKKLGGKLNMNHGKTIGLTANGRELKFAPKPESKTVTVTAFQTETRDLSIEELEEEGAIEEIVSNFLYAAFLSDDPAAAAQAVLSGSR